MNVIHITENSLWNSNLQAQLVILVLKNDTSVNATKLVSLMYCNTHLTCSLFTQPLFLENATKTIPSHVILHYTTIISF